MLPTYRSGDWLMARWGAAPSRLRVGDVIAVELEAKPGIFFVKRISEISEDRQSLFVLSDNPEGTDSRSWGWLPIGSVKAKVLFRFHRAKP